MEKIREVINKRIQEKKKNEFTDLAPIDDIENGAEYLKALHWAIKKKKVKNIALAGPYGAGKSSIIDTYLKKHKIIRSKSLRVSMATFVENETDEKGNPKKISLGQDEIELGILKQLFYKVNYKKIPQSRYRKLHKINWKRVWGYLVLIFLILGVMEFIFFPDTFQMIIEKIEEAGGKFGLKGMVSDIIFLAFCVGILAIIARTYRLVLFRFKVNEVKLPTETVVKNSETAAETVFNKNMDEIVYFFEETKYRIVFFEDLDRLEDPSIFIHLRELNTLLNNYDGIKGRMRWPDMWNDIVQDISITYERKIFYLQLLIDNVDTERLFELNDNNKMSDFIEENPDILQQLSSIQDQKVISLIETLGIIFKNISIENVSEEILRYVFENRCYELNDTMIRRIVEFENDTMLSGLDTRNYTTIISLGYEPLIKYIQENLKQYVKEIILASNNTKEDVEQIMDLLERMLENVPEETEICLELVNHEEFCVDDISECCGKFDSNFDKGVKILWDELLDKGKVSLKWENIKCYWERYKITPELLQYIETNSDQLTFLENQCLNEVFAEELITSTIDDSAFEKLLPQLELEFDIPIEKVERQKVGILIKKKYIPFDVNKYGEIKDAYPDLCPDFILYNQAEYMEVMEKIPMGETLLETLLLSPILDFSNAEVLLDAFGENYMTAKIAENLVDSKVTINKSIFTAAWEYVDEKGKKTLMFKCLSILEAADFENCFSELSQWYSGFCDRSKKHSVELPNNEESQRLAKRLQEVSYITSYKLQEKEVYDSVTETKKKKSTFVCWIKAIKG